MAELTALQQLIVDLVGDIDPVTGDVPAVPGDGIIHYHMAELWERYADKAAMSARLRELYVQRDACDLVLSVVAPEVNMSAPGASISLSSRASTYLARRNACQQEIERVESNAGLIAAETGVQTGRPVMVMISSVEPISPPSIFPGAPNANDPRYTGSPYQSGRRGG